MSLSPFATASSTNSLAASAWLSGSPSKSRSTTEVSSPKREFESVSATPPSPRDACANGIHVVRFPAGEPFEASEKRHLGVPDRLQEPHLLTVYHGSLDVQHIASFDADVLAERPRQRCLPFCS